MARSASPRVSTCAGMGKCVEMAHCVFETCEGSLKVFCNADGFWPLGILLQFVRFLFLKMCSVLAHRQK